MKHSSQIGFFWHQTALLDYFHKQTALKVNIKNDQYILQNKSNHQCYSLLNSQKNPNITHQALSCDKRGWNKTHQLIKRPEIK